MNKEELVKEVSKKAKVSQKATADIIAATLETIEKTVSKGKKVTLVGFGTFEPRKRAARTGRNPQTGAPLKIAAKTVPAFSAGKKFKEMVKQLIIINKKIRMKFSSGFFYTYKKYEIRLYLINKYVKEAKE